MHIPLDAFPGLMWSVLPEPDGLVASCCCCCCCIACSLLPHPTCGWAGGCITFMRDEAVAVALDWSSAMTSVGLVLRA